MHPSELTNDDLKDFYFENAKARDQCPDFDQIEAEMLKRGLLGQA